MFGLKGEKIRIQEYVIQTLTIKNEMITTECKGLADQYVNLQQRHINLSKENEGLAKLYAETKTTYIKAFAKIKEQLKKDLDLFDKAVEIAHENILLKETNEKLEKQFDELKSITLLLFGE